jgi:hypothetical protein
LGQENVGLGLTLAGSVSRCCWLLAAYLNLSPDNYNAASPLRRESITIGKYDNTGVAFSITKCVTNFDWESSWK